MDKPVKFAFSRLLAQLLITASAISLVVTVWLIYRNVVNPVLVPSQPIAPILPVINVK